MKNLSAVLGATVTDALNAISGIVGAITTSSVANVSAVAGATATAALNTLAAAITAVSGVVAALTTSSIANASTVAGATATAALDALKASIAALTTSSIANASTVAGATATAALDALSSTIAALTTTSIANASGVAGATATAALNTLNTAIAALTSTSIANSASAGLGATVTAALTTLRDPIWDPPTTASADDEEFTTDVLASGAWTLALVATPGTPMTRDGNLDLSQAIATGHYRSSCIGSTLYIQMRSGDHAYLWKQLAGALSTTQLWYAGVSFPMIPGVASAFTPLCGLFLFKDNAGAPSNTNQAFVRTGSSADRIDVSGSLAGVTIGPLSSNAMLTGAIDGLAACVAHGSAASNFNGFSWQRTGTTFSPLAITAPQFNAASDKVGFDFLINTPGANNGPNNAVNAFVFGVHFLRRTPINSGFWIAQP